MAMASPPSVDKVLHSSTATANFQRVTRLIIRGGTRLLREKFDAIIPPNDLLLKLRDPDVVNRLKSARLNKSQRDLLFPKLAPGDVNSADFDITLLVQLLSNICNLPPPVTGWSAKPESTDYNFMADVVRIRHHRNSVYAHNTSMEISDDNFRLLWRDISEILLRIAGPVASQKRNEWQTIIDNLLTDPLTPEEERYKLEMQLWHRNDMEVKHSIEEMRSSFGYRMDKLEGKVDVIHHVTEDLAKKLHILTDYPKSSASGSQSVGEVPSPKKDFLDSGSERDPVKAKAGGEWSHLDDSGSPAHAWKVPPDAAITYKKSIFNTGDEDPSAHPTNGPLSVSEIASTSTTGTAENGGCRALNSNYYACCAATNNFSQALAKGGQGIVFEGCHEGRKLAVKKFFKERPFQREKKMINSRHPHTLPLWDICVNPDLSGNDCVVVYPLMEGNLYKVIVEEKGMLDHIKRIQVALNCAYGLKYIHEQGFVYGDFKSSNILLDEASNPCLGDFGLVKEIEQGSTENHTSSGEAAATTTTVIENSKGYRDNISDDRTIPEGDLHGVGVVMMELLTGLSGSEKGIALYWKLGIGQFLHDPEMAVEKVFRNKELKKKIHEAGWPKENDRAAKQFLKLAMQCVNRISHEARIPLKKLCQELKDLIKTECKEMDSPFYEDVTNGKCVFCRYNERDKGSSLACGHNFACQSCLEDENNHSLFCPVCCSEQFSLVGNKSIFAICVAGGSAKRNEKQTFTKDVTDTAKVFQTSMGILAENIFVLTPDASGDQKTSLTNLHEIVKSIQKKVEEQRKKEKEDPEMEAVPITVISVFSGHGDKEEFKMTGRVNLRSERYINMLTEIQAENNIFFIDCCDAENFLVSMIWSPTAVKLQDSKEEVHSSPTQPGPSEAVFEDQPNPSYVKKKVQLLKTKFSSGKTSSQQGRTAAVPISYRSLKGTCAGVCSCGQGRVSTFNKRTLGNSHFFKYLLLAFEGAQKCFDPKTCSERASCKICLDLQKNMRIIGYLELFALTDYINKHLHKAELCGSKVLYRGDGRRLLLARSSVPKKVRKSK